MTDIHTAGLGRHARRQVGELLDDLQEGISLGMPFSRAMPDIGRRCHELRVRETDRNWRIMYHVGYGEIVILTMFDKKAQETPKRELRLAKRRLRRYRRLN